MRRARWRAAESAAQDLDSLKRGGALCDRLGFRDRYEFQFGLPVARGGGDGVRQLACARRANRQNGVGALVLEQVHNIGGGGAEALHARRRHIILKKNRFQQPLVGGI